MIPRSSTSDDTGLGDPVYLNARELAAEMDSHFKSSAASLADPEIPQLSRRSAR